MERNGPNGSSDVLCDGRSDGWSDEWSEMAPVGGVMGGVIGSVVVGCSGGGSPAGQVCISCYAHDINMSTINQIIAVDGSN